MAIEKCIVTSHGLECPSAYIIIVEARHLKNGPSIAEVLIFKDNAAKNAGLSPLETCHAGFVYDLNNSKNIIGQAYDALKTMDKYSNGQDV